MPIPMAVNVPKVLPVCIMVSPNAVNQLLTPNSMSEMEEDAKGHQPAVITGQIMTKLPLCG